MKKVAVITTGGTIAMAHDPNMGVVLSENKNKELSEIPQIHQIADIEFHEFFDVPSPYITPGMMFELSKYVKKILSRSDIDGVVITHGTDTLEETAYFLDLTIGSEKPVVVTAAMRNWSEPSTDGPMNLIASVKVASCDLSVDQGVMVCLNDEIHAAREVTKTYTSNVATFDSPGYGPLGIVDEDTVVFFRRSLERMYIQTDRIDDRVALIKTYTGDNGAIIKTLPDMGDEGVGVEVFGRGNVPAAVADAMEYLLKKNIPVVVVSRCFKGRVLGVYGYIGGGKDLKERGIILGQEVSGQKARIKMIVVLGKTKDTESLRRYFEFQNR